MITVANSMCTPETPPDEVCYPPPEPLPTCYQGIPDNVPCLPAPIQQIPTLSEYGIGLLILIVLCAARRALKPKVQQP